MDSSEVLWTRKSKSRRIAEVEYRAPPRLFNCYIGKNQWVDNKGIIYYKDTDVNNENDQDDSDSEGYENDDYPDSDEEECQAEEEEVYEDIMKPMKKKQRLEDQAYVCKHTTKKEVSEEYDEEEDNINEDDIKEEVKMLVEDAETMKKQIEMEKEKRKKREKCLDWQRRAELDLKSWKLLNVQDWKMSKQRGSIWNHDGIIDLSFGFQKKNSKSIVYCNMVENGWYCSSCQKLCSTMSNVLEHLSTNHS